MTKGQLILKNPSLLGSSWNFNSDNTGRVKVFTERTEPRCLTLTYWHAASNIRPYADPGCSRLLRNIDTFLPHFTASRNRWQRSSWPPLWWPQISMYVCMYVRTYVCMYYVCMYYVCMYYVCIYVRTYVRTYVRIYVCYVCIMYVYVCMYVCTYICMYVCIMYVYMFVRIYFSLKMYCLFPNSEWSTRRHFLDIVKAV
jgi:hypothetical protein